MSKVSYCDVCHRKQNAEADENKWLSLTMFCYGADLKEFGIRSVQRLEFCPRCIVKIVPKIVKILKTIHGPESSNFSGKNKRSTRNKLR
ncbi:MAG: hypothetical protein WC526_02105 [Patescibacteria group bacterium]